MTASSIDSTAAAEHFFAGAVAAGMRHVVLSPGSRSTPLAVAAARTPGLTLFIHLDERSAAFAALGQAKVSGSAVGLVCTSGTAAANYLPAIAESSLSNVPLVAITADRPPEHQHIGVGQSFDQRGLFGRHVRDEMTMPVGSDGGPEYTQRAGWRAVVTAVQQHGPVHVNWAFRFPLEPQHAPIDAATSLPYVSKSPIDPAPSDLTEFNELLARAERPLIVAGPDAVDRTVSGDAHRIATAADALGMPILADVLSGLRGTGARTLIEAPALVVEGPTPQPDLIIRLGQTPTAKSIRLWWEAAKAPQVLVDPFDDWHDPSNMMCARVRCSASMLLERLATDGSAPRTSSKEWVDEWVESGRRAAKARTDVLAEWGSMTEAHLAAIVGQHTPEENTLVASSSMPVRDLDTFTSVHRTGQVLSNRGINGIDGVVSTSIGIARASAPNRPVVHLGDIAALHDVGGILDAARQQHDMTIVIPNNDGGGIFSLLPAKATLDESQFTRLFHTPHGTTFEFLAGHTGISYEIVSSGVAADVGEAIDRSFHEPGVSIVEVPVSTPDRLEFRLALDERIRWR